MHRQELHTEFVLRKYPPRLEFTSDVYQSVLLDTRAIEKFRLGATSIVEDL